MAYYIIEAFNAGLDLRRSREVARVGSLRVLRNAFINSGGEIQKRKAFVEIERLSNYCNKANYKGKVTGPHPLPGQPIDILFVHSHNSLPNLLDDGFVAGAGTISAYTALPAAQAYLGAWATKSTVALTSYEGMMCASSVSLFATGVYLVQEYLQSPTAGYFPVQRDHLELTTQYELDEPTSITSVTANENHKFQIMLGNKGYSVDGDTFYSSAIGDPSDMTGTGSGNVNVMGNGFPIGDLMACGDYFGELTIFGRRGAQFYAVSSDPAATQYNRSIMLSLAAPRSITNFGSGDILYLARDGIRSLQARDSSNFAQVSDVGSPIDKLIQEELEYNEDDEEAMLGGSTEYADAQFFRLAKGVIHAETGQFWLALKDKIYVLSRHPAAKVLAWSIYDLPTPDPANINADAGTRKSGWMADACQVGQTVIFRNFADEVYLYGGLDLEEYDDSEVEVITPYLDMGTPETNKHFTGISVVCNGTWTVSVSTTVTNDAETYDWEEVATITQVTRGLAKVTFQTYGSQIAVKMVSTTAVKLIVAQIIVHYETGEEK